MANEQYINEKNIIANNENNNITMNELEQIFSDNEEMTMKEGNERDESNWRKEKTRRLCQDWKEEERIIWRK